MEIKVHKFLWKIAAFFVMFETEAKRKLCIAMLYQKLKKTQKFYIIVKSHSYFAILSNNKRVFHNHVYHVL